MGYNRRSRQKLGIKAYDYALSSRHLPTRRRFVHQQSSSTSTGIVLSRIRNRGNKELSEQSNCPILQGTKVGSAKEHDQYILIPQRVVQQNNTFFSKLSSNLKEIEYSPADLKHSPATIHIFLTSTPGSLGLKIVPRRHINIQRNHFPASETSPEESNLVLQKIRVHLPKQQAYPQ